MKQALLVACMALVFGLNAYAQAVRVCTEDEGALLEYSRARNEAKHILDIKIAEKWWLDTLRDLDYGQRSSMVVPNLPFYGQKVEIALPKDFKTLPLNERLNWQRTVTAAVRKLWSTAESTPPEALERTIAQMDKNTAQLDQKRSEGKCLADAGTLKSGACTMAGTWRQTTPGVGTTDWNIAANGKAKETGIGYADGDATLSGNVLHIDWHTGTGYSGFYQWTLGSDCSSGEGTLQFKTGRTDSLRSSVKKN